MTSRFATTSLAVAIAIGALFAGGGCAPSGPPASEPTPSITAALGDAPSESPTAAPTKPAPPKPTPTKDPSGALPAGWTLCQNVIRGSSIAYPGGWFTTHLNEAEKCSQFHPDEFTIPIAGEYPLTALNAVQSPETYAMYVAGVTDSESVTVISQSNTTVAGLPAKKIETSSLGLGLFDAGTKWYGYVINRGGKAFAVYAMARPGESRYASWKTVVDQAVTTVRFI